MDDYKVILVAIGYALLQVLLRVRRGRVGKNSNNGSAVFGKRTT